MNPFRKKRSSFVVGVENCDADPGCRGIVGLGQLTVAENASATKIRTVAPTNSNYTASQQTMTVTRLPTDGTVLADGLTPVTAGEVLTVAQPTWLMFKPTAGAFGQSTSFTHSVSDPSGNKATETANWRSAPTRCRW